MAYFVDEIRVHAFQTIHDFENFEDFEAEMIAFGESLPPLDSPTAKDPHYRSTCKSTAAWAWDRKDTIVPYDQFVANPPPEKRQSRKDWTRTWARMRQEYLQGKVLDAWIETSSDETQYWWSCPVCAAVGTAITSKAQAQAAGRKHMQTHISDEDREALEDLKVVHMPKHLLTPFQRRRREALEGQDS